MSSSQKKVNLQNILSSGQKSSLNDRMKGRNYKNFIKRIKVNNSDKFEFSGFKNPNYASNQNNNNNLLNNITCVNQPINNINNLNSQNYNFQSTNHFNKEKSNERYNTHGNNILEKNPINEKRAKSGLASSLSHLEILRKNQESRATNITNITNTQDSNKIPNSNDTNPSSGSNKIDIKISFNYSKANSLNKNNLNKKHNTQNITNNNITNNNYSNYYLRYKNLSKPNSNKNLNSLVYNGNYNKNIHSINYTNLNNSINNCEYLNTYSNLNTSMNNKTAILNASFLSKPTILQESINLKTNNNNNIQSNSISTNKERSSKGKSNSNTSNISNLHHSIQQEKLFKKKINDQDSEIITEEMGEINNQKSPFNNVNRRTTLAMNKQQLDPNAYINNNKLNASLNLNNLNNINKNKPIITNYYTKSKCNTSSFTYNDQQLLDKVNKGMQSLNLNMQKINKNYNQDAFKSNPKLYDIINIFFS